MLTNGQLLYQRPAVADTSSVFWNTLSTTRGRQFRLSLPDGSKVWLNAESSIYYPTDFSEGNRKIKVKGEIYIDVVPDKNKPFIVEVGNLSIKVLGTSFNVNAYTDENAIRTTLINGSIQLSAPFLEKTKLIPGQQASINYQTKELTVKTVNTESSVAWKNNLFDFNNLSLQEALRQIARWYDLDIVYEKEIPQKIFWGEMQRNLELSKCLSLLENMGVQYRLENRTLTIVN